MVRRRTVNAIATDTPNYDSELLNLKTKDQQIGEGNVEGNAAVQAAIDKGEPGFGPPPKVSDIFVAERDQAFVVSKFTSQPIGTFLQPIKLSGAREKVAKKTYVRIPKYPQPAFDKALAECKADKSWVTFELPDAGHFAMLDAPDRVTELILQAA